MSNAHVLEFSGVTKRFRGVDAVSSLTARIEPGVVTGFLGPNGAGKTTSLRMLLGLVTPTSGTTRIGGVHFSELNNPLRTVGAALEASSFHPGRSAANHLLVYARAASIPRTRVDEVLGLVGLADVAGRKVGGFSLGMRQRLGLATALLGDPGVLVLDEPSNGLDPEGIKWMRMLLRALADEGRTVLVSSHLLAEIQQTADKLLILARGRLVFDGGIEELAEQSEFATIVDAPDRAALTAALSAAGLDFEVLRSGLTVRAAEPVEIGTLAAAAGIGLSTLHRRGPTLEEVFLSLVDGSRVHASVGAVPDAAVAVVPDAADADAPIAEATVADAPIADTVVAEPLVAESPAAEGPEPDATDAPAAQDAPVEAAPEPAASAAEDVPAPVAARRSADDSVPTTRNLATAFVETVAIDVVTAAALEAADRRRVRRDAGAPDITTPHVSTDGNSQHPAADDREEGDAR